MTRLRITCLLVFLVLLLCSVTGIVKAYSPGEMDITAGRAEFDPETQVFTGSGGVVIKSGDMVIKAGEVVVDREGWIEATGGVEFGFASLLIRGENLRYNIHSETGEIAEFQGRKEETYFCGSQGEITGANLYIKDAAFTRCCLPVPDLEFAAGELRMEEEMIRTGWGRLRVKGINLLPLPPLSVSLDKIEQWPSVEAGINQEWGLYFSGDIYHPLLERLALTAGATMGTSGRVGLAAGLHWRPTERWQLGAGYDWDNKSGEKTVYSLRYTGARAQLYAGIINSREKGEAPDGRSNFRVTFPLAPQVKGEVFQNRDYPHEITGLSSLAEAGAESYGVKISKDWSPGFFTGMGIIHSRGDLKGNSLPGWSLETTVKGKISLTEGWDLAGAGSYLWGKEEGLWTTQRVEILKDLHCFAASVGYDLLGKEWSLGLNLTW